MGFARKRTLPIIAITAAAALALVGILIVRTLSGDSVSGADRAPTIPTPSSTGVAGYLFQDRDGDGEQSAGEPALAGWEVRVHSTGPAALATTTTDDQGVFVFDSVENITPGETTLDVRVQPVIEGPAVANLPDPSMLTQNFTIGIGSQRAVAVAAFSPCLSIDECEGVVLPDLVPQLESTGGSDYPAPTETVVDTTTIPGQTLLRFATSTANLGGLLHVTAGAVAADGDTQTVQQRVYGADRTYVHDAGQFVYHAEHHHFHLDEFQSYELLAADRETVLRSSEKVSFCLTDVLTVDEGETGRWGDGQVFLDSKPFDCGILEQGINSGFADYYGSDLPDQWIDVTGIPSGQYWVRLTVDPRGLLLESDVTNNVAYFPVDFVAPQ